MSLHGAAPPEASGLVSPMRGPSWLGAVLFLGVQLRGKATPADCPPLPSWLSSSDPLIIVLIKAATSQESQELVVDDCCDSFCPGFAASNTKQLSFFDKQV